jgi:hypothetical protein
MIVAPHGPTKNNRKSRGLEVAQGEPETASLSLKQ